MWKNNQEYFRKKKMREDLSNQIAKLYCKARVLKAV